MDPQNDPSLVGEYLISVTLKEKPGPLYSVRNFTILIEESAKEIDKFKFVDTMEMNEAAKVQIKWNHEKLQNFKLDDDLIWFSIESEANEAIEFTWMLISKTEETWFYQFLFNTPSVIGTFEKPEKLSMTIQVNLTFQEDSSSSLIFNETQAEIDMPQMIDITDMNDKTAEILGFTFLGTVVTLSISFIAR